MKKLIAVFSALMLLCTSAYAKPLYTKTVKATVTGGVSRKRIQEFYGDYALNINLITADLTNEHLSFDLLKNSGGSDKVDSVMNLAKSEENVVAAINADFFSKYKNDQNFSLGIEVKDGELLESHINSNMAAGFFDGEALDFSYIEFSGVVTAPNGESTALSHINKPPDYYGALLCYTPAFNGGISPFLPAGITAVTVVDDVVTAKGVSLGGTIPIPENGYILVIDDNMTPFLEYNFNIGDKVDMDINCTELTEDISAAFGGGTLLLKDGKKTEITHDVSGNNPRSVVGTNADGTTVYFMTVDGRQSVSRGVSLTALQDICLEMGMVNAMNLDGGGSTALVAKSLSNESLHYMNSPTETRKVINAIAITSDAEKGDLAGFIASPASSYVLSGDTVKINLTPYDENYNTPAQKVTSYPSWTISEGRGSVKDNVYYSGGSGKTVLKLFMKGVLIDSCEITVIDEVCGITAPMVISGKSGESVTATVEIFDSLGRTAKVNDLTLLNPVYDKSFVSLSKNSIKFLKEGSGTLTLSHGGAERTISLVCGDYEADTYEAVTEDPLWTERTGTDTFNVLGYDGADTIYHRLVYKCGVYNFRDSGVSSAVVGSEIPADLTPVGYTPVTADKWGVYDRTNARIITLDLSSSGVLSRGSQWKNFANALEGAPGNNVIVLLDKAPSFVDALDKDAFARILQDNAKNKNIFVVYNGDENFCTIKNGVRYITIADSKDKNGVVNSMESFKYLSFSITKDKVTYCFKNLFEFENNDNSGIILE